MNDPQVLEPGNAAEVGLSAERLNSINERLQAETENGDVTSASVLVARHGKIVLHEGFGQLTPHPNAPATQPDTIYLTASISKPVTVSGLMLLVERGKVMLSDPVQYYLPEFKGENKHQVKVGHLLSHTSGLPDMLPTNVELRKAHAPLNEFVTGTLRTPLLYPPGTQFSYQSMGTLLAGEVIEQISGMPLRNFLDRDIFTPLNLKHTVLGLNDLSIEDTAWVQPTGDEAHNSESWGLNSSYWRDMGHPWGGLHSSTTDLAIFLQTFLNGGQYGDFQLLSTSTTDAMIRNHNRAIAAPWGLGWALANSLVWNYFGDLASPRTFGHVGITGTVAWADPLRQLICVLLTTRSSTFQRGILLNSISNLVQSAVLQ